MDRELLHYEKIVEDALRSVVRTALSQISAFGLPGDHSLYVSFQTQHPDVRMSDRLRADYPEEMTIVLEHQFWDLAVFDDRFDVTLSFNRRREPLSVPFAAVTSFADPSVPFGLKFELSERDEDDDSPGPSPIADRAPAANSAEPGGADDTGEATDDGEDASVGEVVNLDAFRKKQ